ncbi:Amidohydrolase 3 [Cordyceps fumosorosea ARSEF 2679]|uniref:Amidohydrolase 3 n=1 Tax=Cordyceps fumosorosea (strain ARSEF 2679) TaxID=1081104 RepID=A0A166XK02_CORFA|nr:Amidohydrolase 3 [Cordyceps fumosorosea ARSEF 2679]OAA35898.1 Amidohydrolase 3 [Cordyceps fumosorosea ARSEF 2679]
MAPQHTTNVAADMLIRAKSIYTLDPDVPVQRSITIQGDTIYGISPESNGLDALIRPDTRVIDEPQATVLPACDDSHTHLIFAALGARGSRRQDATRQLSLLLYKLARVQHQGAAASDIAGADGISTEHPILVRRGGHNAVLNSKALALAGVTETTEVPRGGKIGRDEKGRLNGLLQDAALSFLFKALPRISLQERIAGLEAARASYAAAGIGCVRDCFVTIDDMAILKPARDAGRLHTRVRALIASLGATTVADMNALLDTMEPYRALQNDPWLSVWGVKFMIDGGIEAGATEDAYCSEGCGCPVGATDFRGRLLWEPDTLVDVMDVVLRRGWRIGTHAYGDRATQNLLDVYEKLLERHPDLPQGSLVMEHGALATKDQQDRAVALGIPVTIQAPLLHDVAGIQEIYWGRERVNRIFPVRQWIDAGALVTAGSDFPVGPYGSMFSLWAMATRKTVVGVRGPEYAITVAEGIVLHTTAAAKLLGETDKRGMLVPGRFADLNVWNSDPYEAAQNADSRLETTLYSIIGGQVKNCPAS